MKASFTFSFADEKTKEQKRVGQSFRKSSSGIYDSNLNISTYSHGSNKCIILPFLFYIDLHRHLCVGCQKILDSPRFPRAWDLERNIGYMVEVCNCVLGKLFVTILTQSNFLLCELISRSMLKSSLVNFYSSFVIERSITLSINVLFYKIGCLA
jgi:hypothetical protein